jgi:hypothetical protein
VKLCVFSNSAELNEALMAKTSNKNVRFWQYTVHSDVKQNLHVFSNTWSETEHFWQTTKYWRKSDYLGEFYILF